MRARRLGGTAALIELAAPSARACIYVLYIHIMYSLFLTIYSRRREVDRRCDEHSSRRVCYRGRGEGSNARRAQERRAFQNARSAQERAAF